MTFSTNNAFIVDGTVNTTEVQNGRQYGVIWKIDGETTRIGGLQGSNLYGYNKLSISEINSDRTLTFTNKAGTAANWSGAIENGGNRFNIVMDESAAGSQDLDIVSGTVNDIALKGGIFYISSVSATTGTLSIDGGFYNAKGSGAKFAAIDLSSGGFIFESGALENGYEVSAGEISKSGTEKIVVDFNGLYAPEYYGYEFVLISADAVDETIDLENANGGRHAPRRGRVALGVPQEEGVDAQKNGKIQNFQWGGSELSGAALLFSTAEGNSNAPLFPWLVRITWMCAIRYK